MGGGERLLIYGGGKGSAVAERGFGGIFGLFLPGLRLGVSSSDSISLCVGQGFLVDLLIGRVDGASSRNKVAF